jgi:hypothetical protein
MPCTTRTRPLLDWRQWSGAAADVSFPGLAFPLAVGQHASAAIQSSRLQFADAFRASGGGILDSQRYYPAPKYSTSGLLSVCAVTYGILGSCKQMQAESASTPNIVEIAEAV